MYSITIKNFSIHFPGQQTSRSSSQKIMTVKPGCQARYIVTVFTSRLTLLWNVHILHTKFDFVFVIIVSPRVPGHSLLNTEHKQRQNNLRFNKPIHLLDPRNYPGIYTNCLYAVTLITDWLIENHPINNWSKTLVKYCFLCFQQRIIA